MDITEFASLGGKARAKSLTRLQRSEQARRAALAMWEQRRAAAAKMKKRVIRKVRKA